ncbi:MAG: hypothetical protein RBS13_02705 [Bacteroidales bacterium]|jgi:hypothetical protein|nr:hypothetical protein [Bacteroidales bacterium]
MKKLLFILLSLSYMFGNEEIITSLSSATDPNCNQSCPEGKRIEIISSSFEENYMSRYLSQEDSIECSSYPKVLTSGYFYMMAYQYQYLGPHETDSRYSYYNKTTIRVECVDIQPPIEPETSTQTPTGEYCSTYENTEKIVNDKCCGNVNSKTIHENNGCFNEYSYSCIIDETGTSGMVGAGYVLSDYVPSPQCLESEDENGNPFPTEPTEPTDPNPTEPTEPSDNTSSNNGYELSSDANRNIQKIEANTYLTYAEILKARVENSQNLKNIETALDVLDKSDKKLLNIYENSEIIADSSLRIDTNVQSMAQDTELTRNFLNTIQLDTAMSKNYLREIADTIDNLNTSPGTNIDGSTDTGTENVNVNIDTDSLNDSLSSVSGQLDSLSGNLLGSNAAVSDLSSELSTLNDNLADINTDLSQEVEPVNADNPIDNSIIDSLFSEYETFFDSISSSVDDLQTLFNDSKETIEQGFNFELDNEYIVSCEKSFILDLSSINMPNFELNFDTCQYTSQLRPYLYPIFVFIFNLMIVVFSFKIIRSF